jgi:hypothetical protein
MFKRNYYRALYKIVGWLRERATRTEIDLIALEMRLREKQGG